MSDNKTMNVVNYEALGDFIAQWSKGTLTRPGTIGEFKAQVPATVVELGAGYDDADLVCYIDLPAASEDLTFVIPAPSDIDTPVPTGTWILPDFYSELAFDGEPVSVADSDKETFKSSRIADYSTAKCM